MRFDYLMIEFATDRMGIGWDFSQCIWPNLESNKFNS